MLYRVQYMYMISISCVYTKNPPDFRLKGHGLVAHYLVCLPYILHLHRQHFNATGRMSLPVANANDFHPSTPTADSCSSLHLDRPRQ